MGVLQLLAAGCKHASGGLGPDSAPPWLRTGPKVAGILQAAGAADPAAAGRSIAGGEAQEPAGEQPSTLGAGGSQALMEVPVGGGTSGSQLQEPTAGLPDSSLPFVARSVEEPLQALGRPRYEGGSGRW